MVQDRDVVRGEPDICFQSGGTELKSLHKSVNRVFLGVRPTSSVGEFDWGLTQGNQPLLHGSILLDCVEVLQPSL